MAGELESIYGQSLTLIPINDQIKELQTLIIAGFRLLFDYFYTNDRVNKRDHSYNFMKCLLTTDEGNHLTQVLCVLYRFRDMKIVTSKVYQHTPIQFGEKYFGTE